MSWLTMPMYSPLELGIAILLSALPMSRLSQIGLGLIESRTGISLKHDSSRDDPE